MGLIPGLTSAVLCLVIQPWAMYLISHGLSSVKLDKKTRFVELLKKKRKTEVN